MFVEKSPSQLLWIVHEASNAFDLVRFQQQCQLFFTEFLYHEFYLFSFLQTLDIYILMCKPFQYKEFCKRSHVLKLILKGSIFCMLIESEHLFTISSNLYFAFVYDTKTIFMAMYKQQQIQIWISYLVAVKFLIVKIVYFISVAKMVFSIRKSFDESSKLTSKTSSVSVKRRVSNFALIPVFINILFGIHEGLYHFSTIFVAVNMSQKNFRCSEIFIIRKDVVVCLTAINLTIGSIIYFIGYNALYAKLRENWCRSSRTEVHEADGEINENCP